MIGIYYWKNLITNEYYIGQSIDITRRKAQHKLTQKDPNRKEALYKSMNKYGLENFEFGILEECSIEKLDEKEIYWIHYYNSYNKGLNETTGGQKNCSIGENNPRTKMTNEEVLWIRQQVYLENKDIWEIYTLFKDKISKDSFWSLVHGKTWKNVDTTMIYSLKERSYKSFLGSRNPKAKLNEIDVKNIRHRAIINKEDIKSIYEDYKDKICLKTLKSVINFSTWKNITQY